ncbi:hypothetical protein [Liquorilactobacillus oeni]|uniref:Competence protein ComGD n=1 Tax=Liquorilactobacillus oeni DSM 19972 TaxID=1423777 RepID=A0A0R1MHX5_9LACO|nr:hypothetical protein [Liquorilactobacillus oeni]KRL03979.1 hypothetical protein FD46_GL000146 [Liquorilactobacillus oeni DSM 19972]
MIKRKEAFTLIEAILVLSLSSILLLLFLRSSGNTAEKLEEKIFWQQLKQAWVREMAVVPRHNVRGTVEFKAHEIVFREGNVINTVIKLPATMEIPAYRIIRVYNTGSVTADTIVVKSALSPITYKIVVQFGWGKYYVKQ